MRLEEHINLLSQNWKKKYRCKVMKVGLSLGLVCPNRAKGSCIFCLPSTFTDAINDGKDISLEEQINHLLPKIQGNTKANKFIAYLQDETSTACSPSFLKDSLVKIIKSNIFEEVIISTRPDYLNHDILTAIKSVDLPVTIELGMQTIHDESLKWLNRNHEHQDSIKAIKLCEEYNIPLGIHLILGIPGEDKSMILETIDFINKYQIIKDVKFHNLVIFAGTRLAQIYSEDKIIKYTDYLNLLALVLGNLSPEKTVSRLFTSNLRRDLIAIHPFPGIKQIWLKDLWHILKMKNIYQGSLL